MSQATNAFDFQTVSDVVIQLNYTARNGGSLLAKAATDALPAPPPPLVALFRSSVDFAAAWTAFIAPTGAAPTLNWTLAATQFPFSPRPGSVKIAQVMLFLQLKDPTAYKNTQPLVLQLTITPPGGVPGAAAAVTLRTMKAPLADTTILADPTDAAVAPENFPAPIATAPIGTGLGKWAFTLQPAAVQALPAALQTIVTPTAGGPYAWLNPTMVEDIGLLCFYTIGP